MALPWGIDISRYVCMYLCVSVCAHVYGWPYLTNITDSLPEGMAWILNLSHDKEAAGTSELLLIWLSTEGFDRFYK